MGAAFCASICRRRRRLREAHENLLPITESCRQNNGATGSSCGMTQSIAAQGFSALAKPEALDWVNEILPRLWPHINKAARKIADEQVMPDIQSKLPWPMKVHFARFTLGEVFPVIGPIQVFPNATDGCIKVKLMINYQSNMDIEVSVGIASVGIKYLTFSGELTLDLHPLLNEVPVVGGAMAYFLDPPAIDFTFTGIGRIAELPLLHSLVRNGVNAQVASSYVFPNVSAIPLATQDQGVDPNVLKRPPPMGMLRVALLSATGLKAGTHLKLRLANQEWNSRELPEGADSQWGMDDDVYDFLVFDPDQKLFVDVFDRHHGIVGADNLIGRAEPLKVSEVLTGSGQSIPLKKYCPHSLESLRSSLRCSSGDVQSFGSLLLKAQLLNFVPGRLENDDCCVLEIKVGSVFLPRSCGSQVRVAAKLCNVTKRTQIGEPVDTKIGAATSKAMQRLITRCEVKGVPEDVIADIKSLEDESIVEVNMTERRYFPTRCASLSNEELVLSIVDNEKHELASTVVHLSCLPTSEELSLPGPVHFTTSKGEEIEAQIKVSVLGLRATDHF